MTAVLDLQTMTEEQFKTGMQLLAATVAVITSAHEGVRSGMTATAVCSLSADPASLLVSINRTSRTYQFIKGSGRFAVNLLDESQKEIANLFAGSKDFEEQFRLGNWSYSHAGMPVLGEALAIFDCEIAQSMETKTHTVLCGHITECALHPEKSPLIYGKQQYQRLTPKLEAAE